jgi:hypothetical protein
MPYTFHPGLRVPDEGGFSFLFVLSKSVVLLCAFPDTGHLDSELRKS